MRLLSIGTDRHVFGEVDAARKRLEAYARHFDVFDHIVFTKREGEERSVQRGNLFLLATRSRAKWRYGIDAYSLALGIPRPDVVTVQDPFETGLIGYCIALRWRVPLHVQVHTDPFAAGYVRGNFRNRVRRMIARFVLARAARIRAVSRRVAEEIKGRGFRAPVSVLPIFVDTERFRRIRRVPHESSRIEMLFVGRLEKEKNPMRALEALRAVRGVGHDVHLTVVGDGSLREILREWVHAQELGEHVTFTGWQHDIASYLSRADVVLVPSHFEGYGLTIIEALAAGVPVIATEVGIASEAGVITAPDDEYVASVLRWVENGERTATLEGYPYADFEDYVQQWCEDIGATTNSSV